MLRPSQPPPVLVFSTPSDLRSSLTTARHPPPKTSTTPQTQHQQHQHQQPPQPPQHTLPENAGTHQPPSHSTTPQIHSNKHHNAYNGAAHLPLAVSVKRACRPYMRPRPRAHPLYAVTLYYEHNRACTIIRSRNHFDDLERGLPGIRGPKCTTEEPSGVHPLELQKLLQEAVEKCPREVALEWFLRRRIGDCRW